MLTIKEKKQLKRLYYLLAMHEGEKVKCASIESQIRSLESKDSSNSDDEAIADYTQC